MNQTQLTERYQRLQRKLAACYEGWHSGRVDRLEESLRAIERELAMARDAQAFSGQRVTHH